MNKDLEKYIEREGWVMECESPLELRHEDGSFASGMAANIVLDDLDEDMCFEHNEKLRESQEPVAKTKLKRYEDFEEGDFSNNTEYKIIVPSEKDREELMEAFETIHYSDIDTDIITINQLAHEYLTEANTGDSRTINNIIVDKDLYNKLK